MCMQRASVPDRRKRSKRNIGRSPTSLWKIVYSQSFKLVRRSKLLVKVVNNIYAKVITHVILCIYFGRLCYDVHLQYAVTGFNCHMRESTYLCHFLIEARLQVSLVLASPVFQEASEYYIYTLIIFILCLYFLWINCINLESVLVIGREEFKFTRKTLRAVTANLIWAVPPSFCVHTILCMILD